MHRLTSLLTTATIALFAANAGAQEPGTSDDSVDATSADAPGWTRPLEGLEGTLFEGKKDVGVMLVTPVKDEASTEVRELVQDQIIASGMVDVVMDDAPLGDVSARSDDEILEAAKQYPVDVVVIIRAYPGAGGMTAVMRVQTVSNERLSFRIKPGGAPPWSQPSGGDEPEVTAEERAKEVARHKTEDRARTWAAYVRMGAVGATQTYRLIEAENARRRLVFDPASGFGTMLDVDGEQVPWYDAYTWIDSVEMAKKFRRRRRAKTIAMVTGGVLTAGGLGVLFVSLTNQANCTANEPGCARPGLVGAAAISLSAGLIGLATGALIRTHPLSSDEVEERVEGYNLTLRSSSAQ